MNTMIVLASSGATAFLLRFLAALNKEAHGGHAAQRVLSMPVSDQPVSAAEDKHYDCAA